MSRTGCTFSYTTSTSIHGEKRVSGLTETVLAIREYHESRQRTSARARTRLDPTGSHVPGTASPLVQVRSCPSTHTLIPVGQVTIGGSTDSATATPSPAVAVPTPVTGAIPLITILPNSTSHPVSQQPLETPSIYFPPAIPRPCGGIFTGWPSTPSTVHFYSGSRARLKSKRVILGFTI